MRRSEKPKVYNNEDVIVGAKFGKLTILRVYKTKNSDTLVDFKCDCGKEGCTNRYNIVHGKSNCGCEKHGKRKDLLCLNGVEYAAFSNIYKSITQRCDNPKCKAYPNYGGRGIKNMRKDFRGFWKDMFLSYLEHREKYGQRNTTIDRIDVNGNYCKENCRRATYEEQMINRRNVTIVEYNGKMYNAHDIAAECGISYKLASERLYRYKKGETTIDSVFSKYDFK